MHTYQRAKPVTGQSPLSLMSLCFLDAVVMPHYWPVSFVFLEKTKLCSTGDEHTGSQRRT